LRVEDSVGNVDLDSMIVYVRDERPTVASAGADQSICDSAAVHLDGGNTTDNDPTFALFGNFTWSIPLPGSPLTLYGRKVTFVPGVPGVYAVTMSARDPTGNTASDTLTLTVPDCTSPAVSLPSTVYLTEGDTLSLDA